METIPQLFDERVHNLEVYAQKRIYQSLKLLKFTLNYWKIWYNWQSKQIDLLEV